MKILIVSNKPIEEYQILCVKLFKRYSIINDVDFIFIEDYKYNEKYDYIIYFDNSVLLLDLNLKLTDYIDEKYDLMYINNTIQNANKFIIVKNNVNFINDIHILKEKLNITKIFCIENIINFNENNGFFDNDSLDNDLFLNKIKKGWLFYTCNAKIINEIKNYTYFQIFNKIYNNKNVINIDIIYDKYNYSEDFEIFNPNKDIAFVTLYTDRIKNEGKEMEYNLKEYCIKNNYTCYVHRKSDLEGKRHPTLSKPYLLKKYLKNHKYVIWMDSDIIIFNQKYKIENIINDKYDLIAIKEEYGDKFNAGFLIFKNTEISMDIINKWIYGIEEQNITTISGPTQGDQGIINDVIKNNYLNNTFIFFSNEINCELIYYGISDVKIIHLCGIYGFIRSLFMKYLNYIIFVKNKSLYLVDEQNPHLGGSIEGGDAGTWAPELWNFLIDDLSIKSMIDVGCGEGLTINHFKNKNVEGLGVEGLQESIDRSNVKECIIKHDYTKGSVKIDKEYDLCWSCEFVEHVDEEYAVNFIDTFKNAKYLAMTHAFPNQPGHHHVNCQNPEYWIKLLEENNFKYNNEYSIQLRNMTNNKAGHIKSSLLFFENKNSKITMEERFSKVYDNNIWEDKESKSGKGSSIKNTEIIRNELPKLFKKYNINRVLDAPCGDFNWMKEIVNQLEYYKGIDIVKELINLNNEKYSTDKIKFEFKNILEKFNNDENFDLIICRDALVHLYFDDVKKILENFKNSGIKYLLMTHYTEKRLTQDFEKGRDINDYGMWHTVNFTLEPFNLLEPIEIIEELESYIVDEINIHTKEIIRSITKNDKTLSLWKIN